MGKPINFKDGHHSTDHRSECKTHGMYYPYVAVVITHTNTHALTCEFHARGPKVADLQAHITLHFVMLCACISAILF